MATVTMGKMPERAHSESFEAYADSREQLLNDHALAPCPPTPPATRGLGTAIIHRSFSGRAGMVVA
jgi:hypothetical protein